MILEGCGCWSGGAELQLLVSTWRVQNVNTSRHWDDLILSRSHGERVDKWPESTVRSFSSTSLWSSTPIHSHALSLYSALHIMLLIYLFSYYTYTGMIIRYSTTIVLLICFRNVEHACIQKHYSFAKMIAVWTPQGMAYLRGAGRPQDPSPRSWVARRGTVCIYWKDDPDAKYVSICFNVFNLDPDLFNPKVYAPSHVCCVCVPVRWANGW